MAALSENYDTYNVLIYDSNGEHLTNTVVTDHDKDEQQIQVNHLPKELKVNDTCKLLIMTSPTPCEYLGKVKKVGGNLFIAMFQGQEKESRGATRYTVNSPALIETLIVDGKPYNLHTPIKVRLINISTSGVRFRAPFYSLDDGDVFRMYMEISHNKKKLTAQVVNHVDKQPDSSDYGCCFIE